MTPKNIAPPQLVKEAQEAHELFCGSWSAIKTNTLELGRAIVWMEEKSLHQYIRKGASRKGYQSLEEYALAQTNGECTHTKLYDAKRIYLLTQGEDAIPAETVAKMPKRNQLAMAKVRKAISPAPLPKEMVDKAVREPVLKFAETAQEAINQTKPLEQRKEPLTDVVIRGVHVRVANAFYEVFDEFQKLPIVRDGDRTFNLETKTLAAVTFAARAYAQDAINQEKARANAAAPEIPTEAINKTVAPNAAEEELMYSSPDAAEAIGNAEAEGRVVHRKPEARN
jgi:hypothetical protein